MERPDGNTVSVPPWHPIEHPDCLNCNGLSRPVRRKRPCLCPPVALLLSPELAFHKHVNTILAQAAVPRDTFAARVLGKSPATLWRQLKAPKIPAIVKTQFQSIECVIREGSKLHVTFHVGNLGHRWEATQTRRTLRAASPDAAMHTTVAEDARTLTNKLIAHIVPVRRRRRGRKHRTMLQ